MTRLVVFNDPHFSRHAPAARAESYPHEILDKLHACARLAIKVKATAIGCTGDWFHRKGKVTFSESNDVLAVLRGWRDKGLDVVGILGNHDIAGHALASLDSRAVGSMVHSRVLQLLDDRPYLTENEDGPVYVTGTSYFHGCDSTDEARLRMYGADLPWTLDAGDPTMTTEGQRAPLHVHFAHGTLVQRGEFFDEFTRAPELIDLLAEHGRLPDVIVCGHLHYDEGVRHYPHPLYPTYPNGKPRTVAVCRVGSLGRVAADDFERVPKALVIAARHPHFACKAVPIAGALDAQASEGVAPETNTEHHERIQEFVRVLREEADAWSTVDHRALLKAITAQAGFDERIYEIAMKAVEERQ